MPRVRLPSGELRDEIRQPVYDTLDIQAAESPLAERSFFTAVQGKARSLTNLRQNSLLEATVSYRIMGLCCDSQNQEEANRKALALIQEHSHFQLRVGEKTYWEGNGTYMFGRLWQDAAISTTVAATTEERVYQHFGNEAVQPVILSGKHVIDIPPLQSFQIDWTVEGMTAAEEADATPAANTKLRFIQSLKGLLRRPVQ